MSGAPCQPLVTEIFEGPLVGPCGRRGLGGGGGGGNSAAVAAGVSSRGCDSKTLFYFDDEDAKRCRASAAAASSILGRAREEIASGAEDAFLVMDMDQVRSQAARWRRELPRVLPLYAVKCQPDVEVIKTLAREGFGFDVASAREMELVLEHGVPNGLSDLARNVIYANPCKMPSHIKRISTMGAEMTTLDNVDELRKVHANWPAAKIVVRILGDDTFSVCQFNKKFGIAVEDLPALLAEAKRLGADVVGVSFHVGSGCTSAVPFAKAIEAARRAFDMIEAAGLGQPKFLDLGGGWPGTPVGVQDKHASFEDIAALVRVTLDRLFPAESGVRIVAEPGRYFVAACGSLYTAVHARRAIFTELPDLVANQSLHDGSSASASCAPDADDVGVVGVSPSPAPVSAASSSSPKASANAALDARIRGFRIYVNEGTYGCFNAISNDHLEPAVGALIHADGSLFDGHGPLYECSVWGPTCDSVDMISASLPLPIVQIGDWIEWPQMGAYTSAACAQFNGLPSARIIHINA